MSELFDFDLIFALPETCILNAFELSDRVIGAGFEDAVIGTGTPGLLAVSLELSGDTAENVILQAGSAILQALPDGSRLREVRPDLVSLADVALRLKVKRQALQKRKMPPPLVGGFYRATEVRDCLANATAKRKSRLASDEASPWFAAATGAQRVNAYLALGQVDAASLRKLA